MEVAFTTEGTVVPARSVRAIVTSQAEGDTGQTFLDQLDPAGNREGWSLLSRDLSGDDVEGALSLGLFLAWAPDGTVRWGDARLYDVTDSPTPVRQAHLAVVNGSPSEPRSPAECIDFYTDRLEEAASNRVDLACLPELINTHGLQGDTSEFAEPIPGPTSERLADVARTCGMSIAASVLER
ncbi:MAG: nitrilase-related carbon-nitrogen hydrolase, partial [Candidatus Latescibacteria bacterium]|nr:nitrilase-related carbon-nitrogen hydrolase [Candidatus Latescibacterota bacterium]